MPPEGDTLFAIEAVYGLIKCFWLKYAGCFPSIKMTAEYTHGNISDMSRFILSVGTSTGQKFDIRQFHADTEVYMGDLPPQVIQAYVDTGEPMYVENTAWQLHICSYYLYSDRRQEFCFMKAKQYWNFLINYMNQPYKFGFLKTWQK